ncbi:hypothetical protein [Streptomyces rapamycinicus]|uniref:Uncharacterized protein n=2 Tax=Streptomyces rapamycinicus TaxID=1226757 RepID=A0A0A0NPG9_STRRN|nr:hypothetical protein [Streptomyces rapamycinicus]AGP58023.1 hypothetical protein M271_33020 [Streptomyces rapamycinicus NRRL 5491]MBB4785696.1 hypothetical protein [Streptomyces rapamycinicus]RLV78839.1 hypothetical protein D3C57_110680 [Streptomyces rapamycinicus NRRL 5491]UTO65857.1 hypothetical protein LJB45_28400 [Streptomyces rapamycinicus]UTP33812.1 hypothetical protein LIV37_33530 [Streptomyces rapamycinicus NRRL 5491]
MSRTLPRTSAAKRRGVVLAVAAGALALGAAAPASASASQSSSASASAAKGKTSHGPALCVIRADDDSATPTTPTKPGKAVEHAKPVKLTEARKVAGKKAVAASKDRSRGHDDTCVVIPAFPTHPGKTCKVVVIRHGSGKPGSGPAFPTKPGKHTTPAKPSKPGKPTKPGKPGKPGKVCVIVISKDGHRVTKSSADAKTAAVEATRATRS